MIATQQRQFALVHPEDGARIIRGRVEGPLGFESANPPLPHVLVLHGFKGFMDWGFHPDFSRRAAQRGTIVVRFNMSGSGIGADLESFTEREAFARNTLTRELEDVDLVRGWVRAGSVKGLDPSRAALVGHSRGGGIALIHAAERGGYRSIVTWAAIPDVDRFDEGTKRLWRAQGYILIFNSRTKEEYRLDLEALLDAERNRARLDILAACRRLSAPVLLVHGSVDDAVEVESVHRLFAALDPALRHELVIAGAGHTFGISHPMTRTTEHWETVVERTLGMIELHWR